MRSSLRNTLSFLALTAFFVAGGLGRENAFLPIIVTVLGLIYLFRLSKKAKINVHGLFYVYILFLFISLISIFWSRDRFISYNVFLDFLAGGVIWLCFANNKQSEEKFGKIVILSSVLFSFVFLYIRSVDTSNYFDIYEYTLYWYTSAKENHLRLGDLWAIAVIFPGYKLLVDKNRSSLNLALLVIGLIIVGISQSRSAMISILASVVFLFKKGDLFKNIKYWQIVITFIALLVTFLYIGTQKTSIGARDYWFQSLSGIAKYPLGVGLGNFGVVSSDKSTHILGISSYSETAHNLIFEVVSGVGYFSIIFIVWFIYLINHSLFGKNMNILITSVFLALTVSFLLDFTYLIPSLFYLWFALIGVITRKNRNDN